MLLSNKVDAAVPWLRWGQNKLLVANGQGPPLLLCAQGLPWTVNLLFSTPPPLPASPGLSILPQVHFEDALHIIDPRLQLISLDGKLNILGGAVEQLQHTHIHTYNTPIS